MSVIQDTMIKASMNKERDKRNSKASKDSLGYTIKQLKAVPFGTMNHQKAFEKVREQVRHKYPNQYILTADSILRDTWTNDNNETKSLAETTGIYKLSDDNIIERFGLDSQTIFQNSNVFFVPREDVEYNFNFKQICVFAYITDGEKYILLQKTKNRSVTFIGGHVDFDPSSYTRSVVDMLHKNMCKEINEEIAEGRDLKVPKTPEYFVNTDSGFNDLFHMAFIYRIDVPDVSKLKLTSGEPDKHKVRYFDSKMDIRAIKTKQSWVREIFKL